MNREALTSLRHAVCAVGYVKVPPEEAAVASTTRDVFEVFGTGFLVERARAVTAYHVIEELDKAIKRSHLTENHRMLQFVYPAEAGVAWVSAMRGFRVGEFNVKADLAALELGLGSNPVRARRVNIVGRSYIPTVGDEVGLCSYAHGSALLRKGREIARFGPVVQYGIVAAVSPYDQPEPESLVLDVVSGPAASGAPVFHRPTGEVIGVVLEGQIGKTAALSMARLIYEEAGSIRMRIGQPVAFKAALST